jgi:hypothetical protein
MIYIPKDKCEHRHVYLLHSRNLIVGVYNYFNNGFIGIREKFGCRFLSTEYHWDNPSFATARPIKDLGIIPDNIKIKETLHTECDECKAEVKFVSGVNSHWEHVNAEDCGNEHWLPCSVSNDKLFQELKKFESSVEVEQG